MSCPGCRIGLPRWVVASGSKDCKNFAAAMRSVFDQIAVQPLSDDGGSESGDGEDVNWAAFGRDLKSLQRWLVPFSLFGGRRHF